MKRLAILLSLPLLAFLAEPATSQESARVARADFAAADQTDAFTEFLEKPSGLAVRDVPLERALTVLAERSSMTLAFSPTLLPDGRRVTCDCADMPGAETLERLLEGTGLAYRITGSHVLVEPRSKGRAATPEGTRLAALPVPSAPISISAESRFTSLEGPPASNVQGTVTGRVVDAGSGQPIASVQIYIPGADIGGLTQANGRYILQNVPTGDQTITAERIGYRTVTREVSVGEGESVVQDFELEQEALALDELVVTGTTGQARRREIGNSVSQIRVDEIVESPVSMNAMLQGRTAGVQILQSGGSMGDGSRIRLRGNTSVSLGNEPLIYIDGMRMENDHYPQIFPEHLAGGQYSSYQSASPLDDLNPSNIERIEIVKGPAATTLYGSEAAAGVIQVFTKKGAEGTAVWDLQMDQGLSQAQPHGPRQTLRGTPIQNFDVRSPGGGNAPEGGTAEYQFLEPWLQYGHRQKYDLSVRGGTENVRYFVTGNLQNNEGILVTEWEEKRGIRGNLDITLNDDLSFTWNTSYNRSEWETIGTGNYQWGLLMAAARGENNYWGTNEYDVLNRAVTEHTFVQGIDRLVSGGTLTHTPFSSLSHRLSLGYDLSSFEGLINVAQGSLADPAGYRQKTLNRNSVFTVDYVANYEHQLTSALETTLSVGGESITREEREHRGWAGSFPGPGLVTLSSGAESVAREERQRVITGGVFGQALLGYRDRIFLTLGLRVDGNSAFGSDFGWAPYPKISGSYVISDEAFWPESLGQMKLRAAYGHAGRAPGAFDALRVWDPVSWGDRVAYMPEVPGNPNLGPERTAELEVGFDGSWLDERINGEVTYYRQVTSDALLSVNLAPSQGPWSSQLENIGKIENKGFEVSLDGDVIQGRSWGWNVGLALSTNHSKMLDMGGVTEFGTTGYGRVLEDKPVPTIRGDKILNPDEIADPEVEQDHYFGPNTPTLMVTPSMNLRLPWQLMVTARGEYQGGHYMRSGADQWAHITGARTPHCFDAHGLIDAGRSDELTAHERAWCQRETLVDRAFIYPADFFKLRELSVRVPLTSFVPGEVESAFLTLSGRNIWRWVNEDFRAWDPENGGWWAGTAISHGIWEHPAPPRTYSASLRVTF